MASSMILVRATSHQPPRLVSGARATMARPPSPARRAARGSLNSASGRADSVARCSAVHRAVSETWVMCPAPVIRWVIALLRAYAGVSALGCTPNSRTTAAEPPPAAARRRDANEGCRCIASPRRRACRCAAIQAGCECRKITVAPVVVAMIATPLRATHRIREIKTDWLPARNILCPVKAETKPVVMLRICRQFATTGLTSVNAP